MSSDPLGDARIPVTFGGDPEAGDALLIEGEGNPAPDRAYFQPAPGLHIAGCLCCTPRGPAVSAMTRLFMARARGEAPAFTRLRVIGGAPAEAAVRAALVDDLLVSARYRAA